MKIIISLMAVAMVLSFALAVIHGVELYRLKRIIREFEREEGDCGAGIGRV